MSNLPKLVTAARRSARLAQAIPSLQEEQLIHELAEASLKWAPDATTMPKSYDDFLYNIICSCEWININASLHIQEEAAKLAWGEWQKRHPATKKAQGVPSLQNEVSLDELIDKTIKMADRVGWNNLSLYGTLENFYNLAHAIALGMSLNHLADEDIRHAAKEARDQWLTQRSSGKKVAFTYGGEGDKPEDRQPRLVRYLVSRARAQHWTAGTVDDFRMLALDLLPNDDVETLASLAAEAWAGQTVSRTGVLRDPGGFQEEVIRDDQEKTDRMIVEFLSKLREAIRRDPSLAKLTFGDAINRLYPGLRESDPERFKAVAVEAVARW